MKFFILYSDFFWLIADMFNSLIYRDMDPVTSSDKSFVLLDLLILDQTINSDPMLGSK